MHFKETATIAGSTDTLQKNVGVRAMEGQRSLNVHNVERNIMDSVGHGATHHPTKIHRKEDGKETDKETAREPRKVESSKEEKAATMGKEKVKEREDSVSTKSQDHQKNSGQVDLGNNGQNNFGMLKQTLRVMIGTQQIRFLRRQRQLRNFMRLFVIYDTRIWVLSNTSNLFNMNDWILHGEWYRMQICGSSASHPAGPHRLPTWMCVQHCRPRQSVWSRKEDLVHLRWDRKAVNRRRPALKGLLPYLFDLYRFLSGLRPACAISANRLHNVCGVSLCTVKLAKKIDESRQYSWSVVRCLSLPHRSKFWTLTDLCTFPFRQLYFSRHFSPSYSARRISLRLASGRSWQNPSVRYGSGSVRAQGTVPRWTQYAKTQGMSWVVWACQPFKDEHQRLLHFSIRSSVLLETLQAPGATVLRVSCYTFSSQELSLPEHKGPGLIVCCEKFVLAQPFNWCNNNGPFALPNWRALWDASGPRRHGHGKVNFVRLGLAVFWRMKLSLAEREVPGPMVSRENLCLSSCSTVEHLWSFPSRLAFSSRHLGPLVPRCCGVLLPLQNWWHCHSFVRHCVSVDVVAWCQQWAAST